MVSMGKEGKSLSVSWREQSEPLSLPSVIIYRYFFYRQWASCVQFLCACAKEPRYFPDRGIDRSTDCELTRAARPTPGKIARGATQLRGFDPGPAAGPGGGRSAGRGVARAMPHRVHRGRRLLVYRYFFYKSQAQSDQPFPSVWQHPFVFSASQPASR